MESPIFGLGFVLWFVSRHKVKLGGANENHRFRRPRRRARAWRGSAPCAIRWRRDTAALLPVVGVAHQRDALVRLERGELERSGADRLGAHVAAGHVARIDGREAGGEEAEERRLRPAEMEAHLMVALDGDLLEVRIPFLARVLAPAAVRLAGDRVPGCTSRQRW